MSSNLLFEPIHGDATTAARVGRARTPHGQFETPAFMPVGTHGSVKGVLPGAISRSGGQVILANTYHLMLRPGSELIAKMGGLHRWMRWGGPILTDSGGFQVFSLSRINKIDDDGVRFKSHLDGRQVTLTPEVSMRVQAQMGADMIMAFDDCPPASDEQSQTADASAYAKRLTQANERTVRWLQRCIQAHRQHGKPHDQALLGIVQGGTDLNQRTWCANHVTQFDLPGYAIGGVAVGEGHGQLKRVVQHTAPLLPADRPRYLMGVGYERDIVAAVQAGVDMFDCVLPTRNGRNACAFTPTGQIRLRNHRFGEDPEPIDSHCDCPACSGYEGSVLNGEGVAAVGAVDGSQTDHAGFSRSYLRHLFQAGEMLGPILVTMHNLRHFQRLLLDIRRAIEHNAWFEFERNWPVAFEPVSVQSADD